MRLRLTLVGLFFALMFVHVGVNSYFSALYFSTASDPGWQIYPDGRIQTYTNLSGAQVAPLRDGDQIVALDGRAFEDGRQYFETFKRIPPGSPYTIIIRRDELTQELTLRTAPYLLWLRLNAALLQLIIPLVFLLVGATVFFLKPADERALLLALMLGMFWASGPPFNLLLPDASWWVVASLAAHLAGAWFAAVTFHFFLVFPKRAALLRRFPRATFYLYVPFLLTAYPFVAISAFWILTGRGTIYEVIKAFPPLFFSYLIVSALYLLSGLSSLIINYRKANQLSRRKLRVVLVGALAGLLPYLSFNAAFLTFEPALTTPWLIIIVVSCVSLLLLPVAFAYAVVRHQVIPVRLIIRRGVQYLLAKNALRVLLALPLLDLALSIAADPHRTLTELLFRNSPYFYLLIVLVVGTFVFRRRLSAWVDRKFFREAYNQDKILRELIDDVKQSGSMAEMSKLVSQRVDAALHPERMYLFYREEERRDLSLGYSSGGSTDGLHIPEEFELLRFMERQGGARDFPFTHKTALPDGETNWLDGLDTRLIVPLTGTDNRLSGLFLLGGKKSEEPYTAGDRLLLESLAAQIAIVYENARLKERVNKDRRIKHEVLARVAERDINLLKECPRCGACYDRGTQVCTNDDSDLTLTLPVERVIEGRYRLDQLIGRGGMGAVYQAFDLRLNRRVAVKILGGQLFGNLEALRRFEREAQTAARLSHPHIITVYDYGALSTEGAYLVMELAEGETLNSIIRRERRIPPALATQWFGQILAAVGAAHAQGVIHRDLKPDNVLITRGEPGLSNVKVLDFGLAKLTQTAVAGSQNPTMPDLTTTPGVVMGTLGYMSPEQLTGGEVDARSDLFSIGVMVVEALTGRRPFTGKTYHELLTAILQNPFHFEGNAREAHSLNRALQKCLAKDRAARYASAVEMQKELIPAIRRCPPPAATETDDLDAATAILRK